MPEGVSDKVKKMQQFTNMQEPFLEKVWKMEQLTNMPEAVFKKVQKNITIHKHAMPKHPSCLNNWFD